MGDVKPLDPRLAALREAAKGRRDPTCADGTLELLLDAVEGGGRVLEIGAAEGLTTIALLLGGAGTAVAVEKDPDRARTARENFASFGLSERVTLYEGDAGEILPLLEGPFDVIFSDGPKAQYLRYLPDCKRLLRKGGRLFTDDVLLYGWVRGEPPKKRRMLVEHIREYLAALAADPDFETEVLDVGEGLAVSKKV